MVTPQVELDRPHRLLKYCTKVFRQAGRPIVFPEFTDPTRTYQWRYLEAFCRKLEEWELDDYTGVKIMIAMVDYAKRNGSLKHKGLAILANRDILEIGYKWLEKEEGRIQTTKSRLAQDHAFMQANVRSIHDLLRAPARGAFPNLVLWYMQGRLSVEIISVSAICHAAYHRLPPTQRANLPTFSELDATRKWLMGRELRPFVKHTMGEDLLILGS
jgi:hypothetical protein